VPESTPSKFSDWGISEEDQLQGVGGGSASHDADPEQRAKSQTQNDGQKHRGRAHRYEPHSESRLFPYDTAHFKGWDLDNYRANLQFLKKEQPSRSIQESIAMYRRVIGKYEGNKFEEAEWQILTSMARKPRIHLQAELLLDDGR